jgi:hypothetical protein
VNAAGLKWLTVPLTLREALLITFKFCVVTGAVVAVAYYAIASVNISGPINHDFTAVAIIRKRFPLHLVSPAWIVGGDQFDVLFRWNIAEIKARLTILLVLWVLAVSALVWRFTRRHATRKSGLV